MRRQSTSPLSAFQVQFSRQRLAGSDLNPTRRYFQQTTTRVTTVEELPPDPNAATNSGNTQNSVLKRKSLKTPLIPGQDSISLNTEEPPQKFAKTSSESHKQVPKKVNLSSPSIKKETSRILPKFSLRTQQWNHNKPFDKDGISVMKTSPSTNPGKPAKVQSSTHKEVVSPLKTPFVDLTAMKNGEKQSPSTPIRKSQKPPVAGDLKRKGMSLHCDGASQTTSPVGCRNATKQTTPTEDFIAPDSQDIAKNREGISSVGNQSSGIRKFTKRKTPFIPPGDFISLDTSDPPQKQRRIAPQSLDRDIATSVEKYYRDSPYTLTESRRLFMRDQGSSAIYDFFLKRQQSEAFLNKKRQLTSALQRVIRDTMMLNSDVFLVGSSINGFGSSLSDTDLCLVLDTRKEKLTNRRKVLDVLYSLQRLLRQASFAKELQVIPAKVPILKFRDALSGVHCDINVNNLTGIRNSELLKCYSILDHRVRPLVITVKEWAHQQRINDASRGTLSSYSLVLMVIHFLQCGVKPPVLPALQKDYPHLFSTQVPLSRVHESKSRMNPFRSTNKMSLFDLLQTFFEYFGKQYDFETQVMSVREGKSRHVRYFVGEAKEWSRLIKIEEPFEQSNTARAVHCEVTGQKILRKLRNAYEILRTYRRLDRLIQVRPRSQDCVIVLDD